MPNDLRNKNVDNLSAEISDGFSDVIKKVSEKAKDLKLHDTDMEVFIDEMELLRVKADNLVVEMTEVAQGKIGIKGEKERQILKREGNIIFLKF